MERLTIKMKDGNYALTKLWLSGHNRSSLLISKSAQRSVQRCFNRPGALEDELKRGTLIHLPVPVGTRVYILCRNKTFITPGRFRVSDLPEWGMRVFGSVDDAVMAAPGATLIAGLKEEERGKDEQL